MSRLRLRLVLALALALTTVAVHAQDPKQPGDSTLSASLKLKDIELSELLTKLEVKLDYAVSGKVTVEANVSVPLGEAVSSKAYRLKGQLTSPELKLEGLRIRNLSAEVLYADGKLTLTSLKGTLPADVEGEEPGEFRGSATAAVEPRGGLTADLTLTRIPLGEVLKSLPGGVPVVGAVNGKARFRAPVSTVRDPATWVASAELSATA
jgi:translocation and assembly module TamB